MNEAKNIVNKNELELENIFKEIDKSEENNSIKVLKAFHAENVMETDLYGTNGYGYNDTGRDKIERVFAHVLGAEDALVRSQIISGTHALTITLFGLLRPKDMLLSITGTPYDTLHEVIGIKENNSSLISYGIKYDEVELINDDFNYELIKEKITKDKVKVIAIQRSKGYSTRKSLSIAKLEKVISFIKNIDSKIIIMVDNCYTEFVEDKSPLEVGADIIVGSLIKNLGGGICPNGGYVAGKTFLVNLVSERLFVPGQGKEVGPSNDFNRQVLQGLYHAPKAVASSLKTAILTSKVMKDLGYDVEPEYNEPRCDIVQNIIFHNEKDLLSYVRAIQASSAIDSSATVIPTDMPGYSDKIVMASGSFVQGSSIELSCDGPIREPYIAYQQGSLTYAYGKYALINAVSKILENKKANNN